LSPEARGDSSVALTQAASVLAGATKIMVFTGAGISTESGIPDFRGPNGLWTKVDPEDFTIERYLTDRDVRVSRWRMHQRGELWGARSNVQPNGAHRAVTALWQSGRMCGCITQNVDGLHQAAGLPDEAVAEVHGNVRKASCLDCHTSWATEEVLERVDAGDEDPHCPRCGGLIKTNTIMFGEMLPHDQFQRALAFSAESDAVVAVGTTLSVYPAADFALSAVAGGAPLIIVNLGPTEHDHRAAVRIDAQAGDAVPDLVEILTGIRV
jgi:NAD-dependent deacetylase